MNILIFIIVIVALIIVHELGHFFAAKLSGMRVDEFGIGYPPRAMTIGKLGETRYTLNWLPFGGFVKIYGENGGEKNARAFSARPRILQAFVLIAGIAMNLIFAYVLIVGALIAGTPQALSQNEIAMAHNEELTVANVVTGTPASLAGLMAGDSIMSARDAVGQWNATDSKSFTAFVSASDGRAISLDIRRDGAQETIVAVPKEGIVASDPFRYALGVEVATVGVVQLPVTKAIIEGASITWGATVLTAQGLSHFFYGVFTLSANLSQVSGPIGIAGAVGTASAQGLGDLLSIMAIISINLALINLVPVPALDGGRLLFVVIESIIRRPIKANIAHTINMIGFTLLILLMAVVTAHDIFRIVG